MVQVMVAPVDVIAVAVTAEITGGVWGVMNARSEQQIRQKYPQVNVMEARPSWMSDADYNNIIAKNLFDIDDEPHGWLSKLDE